MEHETWLRKAASKERIDEMDGSLATLESKSCRNAGRVPVKADQLIADLRNGRNEFENTVRKQAKTREAAWQTIERRLGTQWKAFDMRPKSRNALTPALRTSSNSRLSCKAKLLRR